MVMDDERIHGFGRLNQYDHVGGHVGLGKTRYLLYAANRSDFDPIAERGDKKPLSWSAKKPDIPTQWKRKIDLLARGMVLCKGVLFVAGPPDLLGVVQGNTPHPYIPAAARSLQVQREALDGKQGTLLCAFSSVDGEKLTEYRLDGLPAWDGLIAARGRLYVTMRDGTVTCFRGGREDGSSRH